MFKSNDESKIGIIVTIVTIVTILGEKVHR